MTSYLFGDTDIAAQRLRLVAEVYTDSTRAFLHDRALYRSRIAVDLGCGLGYTTHLLAQVLQAEQTVGLDNSARFIALAQQTQTQGITFSLHDVERVPFPVELSDLLFCRLLMTHVDNSQAVLERWATQLQPHGLLLMEEVEWIHTNSTLFTTYLDLQQALLTHQSHCLYVGPVLDELAFPTLLRKRTSEVRRIQVAPAQAATMFSLNFQMWKHHPFVREHYASKLVVHIEENLQALMEASAGELEIEWGFRQLVYERI